jgi:LemA protein
MTLWIILGVAALLVIWFIAMYNGFIKARLKVDNSWSDIRVFLR